MPKRPRVPPPFRFPPKPHRRVHGPRGHNDYRAYKPWLRDEFEFRCVYCLTRELWVNAGYNAFTIDHVKPKSSYADLIADYDNLVYACNRCNNLKSIKLGLPDPCNSSLAKHLKLRSGIFIHVTPLGRRLIEYLKLNEQGRIFERMRYLITFNDQNRSDPKLLLMTFGYPPELPDLSALNPPGGNSRPNGLKRSKFARKKAGKLPLYY
jgi:HNH endonuclease